VKLIGSTKNALQFRLGRQEKQMLLALLKVYPCSPAAREPLSKAGGLPDQEAAQKLLDEALAEHRQENRRQLQALLADPRRWQEQGGGWRLSLSPGDLEWLLQVLNDIRVGSWVLLGSPEQGEARLDQKTAPHYWAMELSGQFQVQFLEAIAGSNY
jgi:hypothetical protein